MGGLASIPRFFLEISGTKPRSPIQFNSANVDWIDRRAPERARLRLWAFGGVSLISKTSLVHVG
jgi:hypothetical protein